LYAFVTSALRTHRLSILDGQSGGGESWLSNGRAKKAD
jgi:hypothetical protein